MEMERKKNIKTTTTKRTIITRGSIPAVEKLLYLLIIMALVVGVGFVGKRYVEIAQYNHEIQQEKIKIAEVKENNETLQRKIKEMSSPERVQVVAAELGMTYEPKNVHTIGSSSKKESDTKQTAKKTN